MDILCCGVAFLFMTPGIMFIALTIHDMHKNYVEAKYRGCDCDEGEEEDV